ncbi:unnamed protein product [Chrysoparadoxa australica]
MECMLLFVLIIAAFPSLPALVLSMAEPIRPARLWVKEGDTSHSSTTLSPAAFLAQHPRGPYTCLRTVDSEKVLMLDYHMDRLFR